jgi:hypothetical protein
VWRDCASNLPSSTSPKGQLSVRIGLGQGFADLLWYYPDVGPVIASCGSRRRTMKNVYLVMVLSCWWLPACMESNPQPMPHGPNDVAAGDIVSAEDGIGLQDVAADLFWPEDSTIPDSLSDVFDADGSGEDTDVAGDVTDGQGEVADWLSELSDLGSEVDEGDVESLDVPGELDGDLFIGVENPGAD